MSEATSTQLPSGSNEAVYWRSLEQLVAGSELPDGPAREFPVDFDVAPDEVSRRSFLSAVAASVALAGLAGCRKPKTTILPFNKRPEGFTPGVPQLYATTLTRSGYGIGVLVKSSDGRPTKIEGNPGHPSSLGGSDARLQAELLQIYDPGRSHEARGPGMRQPDAHAAHGGHGGHGAAAAPNRNEAYELFYAFWEGSPEQEGMARQLARKKGQGLHVLMPPTSSPALEAMVQKTRDVYPEVQFHCWDPLHRDESLTGVKAAFGTPLEQHVDFTKADVIVSFDCDFLALDGNSLRCARDWATRRREPKPGAPLSRLFVFESCYSTTGTVADNRLRMNQAGIAGAAMALAAQLGVGQGSDLAAAIAARRTDDPRIAAIAADLQAARGRSAVVVGPRMPAAVHALAHAINAALGNHGQTITFTAMPALLQQSATAGLQKLEQAAKAGQLDMLVCLGTNPVYDAPADLDFAAVVRAAKHSIHVGLHRDETAQLCQWHFPLAHELESWGDARAHDGTVSLQQPLVAPLHAGISTLEFLALLSQQPDYEQLVLEREGSYGYTLLREHWKAASGAADFESFWRQALHDGLVAGSRFAAEQPRLDPAAVAALVRASAPGQGFEIHFRPCAKMWDGRYANNSWLQELPDPLTKLSWDNAALLGPQTGRRLGVQNGDLLAIELDGRSLQIPAWILPGHAEECATIPLGWGRNLGKECKVAQGTGFNGYRLRAGATPWSAAGAKVTRANGSYPLVCTQEHGTMAGRALVREATAEHYQRDPRFAPKMSSLDKAARLKGKTEQDLNKSLWQERGYLDGANSRDPRVARSPYQWGMVIDLNVCTGCSACVVACVAENNIAMVGKTQVARNREMFWIRADRYFTARNGEDLQVADNPRVANMPVPCMQCENAPCESVCPVAATTHSPDGLNDMAYNRCIGTRYCSNNCPYKVRRFNYLDYVGKVPETRQMAFNPDVTVRHRGVMEKCTYCVQRINGGRIAAKMAGKKVGDGKDDVRVQPACAQACPTQAITFGNLLESDSKVVQLRQLDLNYGLLSELNTKPRTTYLGRVLNPNNLQGDQG